MSYDDIRTIRPQPAPTGPWLPTEDGRWHLILGDGRTGCGLLLLAAHPGTETWPRCGCCAWLDGRGGAI